MNKVLASASEIIEHESTDTQLVAQFNQHHQNSKIDRIPSGPQPDCAFGTQKTRGKRDKGDLRLPLENLRLFHSTNPPLQSPKTTSRFKEIQSESAKKKQRVVEIKEYETFGETEDNGTSYSYNNFSETKQMSQSKNSSSCNTSYQKTNF